MDKILDGASNQKNPLGCNSYEVTNVTSFISKSEFETGYVKEKTFAEKLVLIASTIRNHRGIQQIKHTMYNAGNKMCVLGLLGFRSGILKDDLMTTSHAHILGKYGITEQEIMTELPIPAGLIKEMDLSFFQNDFTIVSEGLGKTCLKDLFILNDIGWAFDQLADYLDDCADKLR